MESSIRETAKHPRMPWEKPYIEALITKLKPFGSVLEVGFGLGYSSSYIQTFHPSHHTILEPDLRVAKQAITWASQHKNISILQGAWEKHLPTLGIFDTIFFNEVDPNALSHHYQYKNKGHLIIEKGKALVADIQKQFPEIQNIRYSDNDLEELFLYIETFDPVHMTTFLQDLVRQKQISNEQLAFMLKKHKLPQPQESVCLPPLEKDPMLCFLQQCLQYHMRKGSRFSCFCLNPFSKFEDGEFFDAIITNPELDYEENLISVEVPSSCDYYPYKEALVLTVEKKV